MALTDVEITQQINEVLDMVRPQFWMHGGNIELVKFEAGTVYVRLHGACDGCPSSTYTLKLLVEAELKKEVPQVLHVEEVID
jgi:Fe-S cluster biogenesis protein NfuA